MGWRIWRVLGLALFLLPVALAAFAQSGPVNLRIIHFNDLYEMRPRDGVGGVAEAMTLIHHLRAEQPVSIVTFGGDLFSPSLLSGFDKGAHMVALTGAMGVEVAVLGNHEFDFGPDNTTGRLRESKYPWLGANITRNGAPLAGVAPSFIREIAGFKFGFLGVTSARSAETTSAGPSIAFADPVTAARREAAALRQQGAEIVIALCHLEYASDLDLLRQVPAVDICLSGDDHVGFIFYDGRQLSIEAGSDLSHLAVLDLQLWRVKSGDREVPRWRAETRLVSTAGIAPDPEMAALVGRYTAQLDASLNVEIGKADGEFDSRRATVRTREAAFGNLLADAMREATGADIAVVNGGGIRADKLYPSGHTFTRRDIFSELPFGNMTLLLQVTGAQVKAALENGVSQVEDAAGRFPQVSGLTFEYDPKAKAGERVGSVSVGGKPLDSNATYKLATNDFMARGGDGYVSLRDAPRLLGERDAKLIASILIDHIAAKKTVKAATDGRITAK